MVGQVGSGRIGFGLDQLSCGSKTGHFKLVKNGFGLIRLRVGSDWVGLTCIFHMNFFFKENNMYLPFRKSCNKLLDVKCVTLNSPLISRTNYTY